MRPGFRTLLSLGVACAVALVTVGPRPALACRPATGVAVARAAHELRRPQPEPCTGRVASIERREGCERHATSHDAPPRATHPPQVPDDRFTGVRTDPRGPTFQSGVALLHATRRRVRVSGVWIVVADPRTALLDALFHEANAPPLPATEVAGLPRRFE